MTEALKQTLVAKTHDLMNAPSCCAEAKAAAQRWLDALGTSSEAEETRAYIAELEGDIMPVDMLVAFMGSNTAVKRRICCPMRRSFRRRVRRTATALPVRPVKRSSRTRTSWCKNFRLFYAAPHSVSVRRFLVGSGASAPHWKKLRKSL